MRSVPLPAVQKSKLDRTWVRTCEKTLRELANADLSCLCSLPSNPHLVPTVCPQVERIQGTMSKLTAQRTGSSALPEPSPISAVTNGSEAPPYLVPEERQDTAEPAQPAHDFEFREIRLHTEPVIHQRSFMHFIGSALGVQTDHVTGVHATNEIRTSKYTILTFLPKNLFYQFMRVANLYFLLMAVR